MKALQDFIAQARVLIIDDELANVRLIEGLLEDNGQLNFRSTTDSRRALDIFREFQPDIVLLDLLMPHLDGFAILDQLRGVIPPDQNLPIIVLTAVTIAQVKQRALGAGARDFLTKPFEADELLLRTRNLLELRFLHLGLQRQNKDLEVTVQERTLDLQNALRELQESQKSEIRQERLHAFGQMASGVVHDFNNTLTILLGYSELLLMQDLSACPEVEDCVRAMNTSARDASAVVERLRHFYRPRLDDDHLACVQLDKVVDEAVQLTKPRWSGQTRAEGRPVTISANLKSDLRLVCNPSEIREVLINLIFNALDAMPEGGTISLRTEQRDSCALIEISDTGAGMTEEVRARCLEPFFSTKGNKGTGLGLAMVDAIIRRHEGTVTLQSQVNVGTTFQLLLPIRTDSALEIAHAAGGPTRRMRILLAEDDSHVRKILSQQLTDAGHTVAAEADGLQALEQFSRSRFDLLITDLSMPRLNGQKLAVAAKKIRPIPVIMITGFGAMLLPQGEKPPEVDFLLSKPLGREALLATVQEASRQSRL